MTKRTTGFPLPEVTDPDETMAVCICVPKERTHLAAFWGALYQLTMWNSWMEDDEKRGKDVAAVWLRYYLSWDRNITDKECEDCDMGKCCTPVPVTQRINPDTGRPEVSYDGGATWQPDPNDIQTQLPLQSPIVTSGGSKTKCDAATNASEHINELISATSTNIGTAGDVFALTVAIAEAALALVVFLVTGGAASPIIIAFATAIWAAGSAAFGLGKDGFDTYWTEDKKDAILCALYCNIGENGQFTEAQYQAWRSKVKGQLPASPALDIVMTSINAAGATGLSNMASYGNAALSDCASCDCSDCEHGIADVWTFYNATDVVFDGCRTYTMKGVGGDAHFAASTGNCAVGNYWDRPLLWSAASTWSKDTACSTADNVDPKTHQIWNFDVGPIPLGEVITITFSSDPI